MSHAEQPWLLPLLREIQPRPGMYLGHENARLLEQFLLGYRIARVELGFSEFGLGEPDHLQGFTEWLRGRHGIRGSTVPWYALIEQVDPTDRNLQTFFEEFVTYLSSQNIDFSAVKPVLPKAMRLE